MKTPIFIANIVSAIFLINLLFVNPTITGFAVAPDKATLDISSPLGFAVLFIITTIALDVYFYLKTKK